MESKGCDCSKVKITSLENSEEKSSAETICLKNGLFPKFDQTTTLCKNQSPIFPGVGVENMSTRSSKFQLGKINEFFQWRNMNDRAPIKQSSQSQLEFHVVTNRDIDSTSEIPTIDSQEEFPF